MIASLKRDALTADDLLRTLEGPQTKRPRLSPEEHDGSSSENFHGHEDSNSSEDDESVEDDIHSKSDDEGIFGRDAEEASNPSVRIHARLSPSLPQPAEKRARQPLASSFTSFGVSAPLIAALGSMSIKTPTPVQSACIPPLLSG
jgi:ATP-dependent RNA helicase DDX49/DBP8